MKCLSLSLVGLLLIKEINCQTCNYGMANFFSYIPAPEDYCQNSYFPAWVLGVELSLSYEFTCDYSGSSPKGYVTTYDGNGCSGDVLNMTEVESGFFRCCEGCDDACSWLYYDGIAYDNDDCSDFDAQIFDYAFLDWTGINNITLGNYTSYSMEYNDSAFRVELSTGDTRIVNIAYLFDCMFIGNVSNNTSKYYTASITDEDINYYTTTFMTDSGSETTTDSTSSSDDNGLGCNNYLEAVAVDFCYLLNETASYDFTCDGTDLLIGNLYYGTSCSGIIIDTITIDNTTLFTCDESEACDAAAGYTFYNGDCTGNVGFVFTYFIDICYSFISGTSWEYTSCDNDFSITQTTYSASSDCTGSSYSYTFNSSYLSTSDSCVAIDCDDNDDDDSGSSSDSSDSSSMYSSTASNETSSASDTDTTDSANIFSLQMHVKILFVFTSTFGILMSLSY